MSDTENSKSSIDWGETFQKVIFPAIFAALLTLSANIILKHYEEINQRARLKDKQALEFQREVLIATGDIRNYLENHLYVLRSARRQGNSFLKSDFAKETAKKYTAEWANWRTNRLIYRSIASSLYGEDVANAIQSQSEIGVALDSCGIEISHEQESNSSESITDAECSKRQAAYSNKLKDAVKAYINEQNISLYESLPAQSYNARLRLSHNIVEKYAACLDYYTSDEATRDKNYVFCGDMDVLEQLAINYGSTVNIAREQVASSFPVADT